jgi:F-type H+-transporting ATPase subunit delta
VRQSIRGYADAVIEQVRESGPRGLTPLAQELAAVRDVIAGSDDLRRVLVDPGVAAGARKGIIDDLFGSRVGDQTIRLLRNVAQDERVSDTVESVGGLVVLAEAASQNLEAVGDTILGHKAAEERLDGYATAVLEGVDRHRGLGEIEDELFRFLRVVGGSDELRAALTSRDVPADHRKRLVTDLLKAKATPQTTAMASYATQIGRPRDYEELLEYLVDRVAAESNRRLAEVRSALELDESQRANMVAALTQAVGHEVDVRITVDPSVVGGFVATIGDTVIDASARHQLDLLRERLVAPDVRITTPSVSSPTSNPDSQTGERH